MEQVDPTGKLEKATSPSIKKATGFSKLSSKVARKRSLKGRKQEKRVGDPLLTHTADSTFNHKASASPSDSCAPKSSFVVLVPLTKSSSKSEDSLDSGIYSGLSKKERQKSCDSVDSIGSTGSASYNMDQPGIVVPHATAGEMHGATQPMNANKYDDYWREYQDIRQSIIAQDEDSDEKRSVTRTDSGEDEDESDWLRQAGLAGLVTSTNSSSHAQSELENTSGKTTARLSTDSLTSMTILNTLTRPQREAVLRRITSFNRVQKSKRLPIHAIFPQSSPELPKNQEGLSAKPPMAPPVLEVSSPSQEPEAVIDELVGYKTSKSTSLPYKLSGYEEGYQRRYSEVTKRSTQSSLTETDKPFSSLISAFSTSSLDTGHVLKLDQKGYQRKEALDSIVATEPSAHPSNSHATLPISPHSSSVVHKSGACFARGRSLSYPSNSECAASPDDILPQPFSDQTPSQSSSEDFIFPSPRPLADGHNIMLPIKSFLHGVSKEPLSKKFTSAASQNPEVIQPFEFSPITLTTSIVALRQTKVIHSSQFNPTGHGAHHLPSRSNLTMMPNAIPSSSNSNKGPGLNPETNLLSSPMAENKTNVCSSSENDLNITFSSSLNVSRDNSEYGSEIAYHTFPYAYKAHRRLSLKSRHSSPSEFPRRKLMKPFQISLPKVSTLSLSNLATSPKRMGSYKVRRHSPRFRRLKRAASLYGEPGGNNRSFADPAAFSNRNSASGIETLSIQSRSVDDATWRDNFAEDAKTKQAVSYSETADQENLPNFSLVRDRLGITRISDLSTQDMHKVQSLALIELTALFDLHNIELKRRKFGKVKMKETGLFGITLIALLDWDQKRQSDNDLRVPMVLQEIITFLEKNGLEDEGILRVPGSAVRIKNLKQCKGTLTKHIPQDLVKPLLCRVAFAGMFLMKELAGKFSQTLPTLLLDPNASWNEARTNDVAAVLKQFLRELPNPLLSMEYIDAFQSCDLIPDRKQQLQALNLLIILLNNVHRDSLKLLLKFLSKVVAKEEINKMTLNNVAMIMAPNLFMGRKQTKKGETPTTYSASQDVKHAAGTSNVVRMLIKYHKLLWTVPTFMLTQVRNMNQAEHGGKKQSGQSREKIKIKFPGITKTKDPQIKASKSPIAHDKFDYEVPKGVIRVKVENHSMTSMAVQLDGKCTAGDVIAKFQKQCERAKQMSPNSEIAVIANETHALYEVGGNIFERCLDPGTNMHALTKINPDATWIIKKRPNL